MPYIVTTKYQSYEHGQIADVEASHRAVATLDEARREALETVRVSDYRGEWMLPHIRATNDLADAGGTVGPVPDGTVIQVERVDYDRLLYDGEMGSIGSMPAEGTDAEIIAAYNAAQERGK